MDEKSLREIKNRVVAEELIPKRESGGMTYQTGSLTTHWSFEGQVQMSSGNTLEESCLGTVQYSTTKAIIGL